MEEREGKGHGEFSMMEMSDGCRGKGGSVASSCSFLCWLTGLTARVRQLRWGWGGVVGEEMIMPICGECQVCRPSPSSSSISRLRDRDAPLPSSHSISPLQLPATTLTSTMGH
ncbi:uncharacterized [Tachysurus ichikawai]